MTPFLLVIAGLGGLVLGALVLRSYGPRYRVGRLLSTTPTVSVADAISSAAGPARYLRIIGRIDAAESFEDDAHRPLVLRRTRLEVKDGRDWQVIDDRRDAVPFDVREGLDSIRVDAAALDAGLVVMPRESVGTAGEAPDRVPKDLPPATPVRLRVDQVSSVEHAIVLGVPTLGAGGVPTMGPGLGRPLILTTLEPDEAMRVLAGGSNRPLVAALSLTAGLVLGSVGLVWAVVDQLL